MDPKALSADFRDFLNCLNGHGVEYLLIKGDLEKDHYGLGLLWAKRAINTGEQRREEKH